MFATFRSLIKNGLKLNKIAWQEKRLVFFGLLVIFVLLSAVPFVLSGSRGLLINELINNASSGSWSNWLVIIILIFGAATLIPPFLRTAQDYLARVFWLFLEQKFELLIAEKKAQLDVATHESPTHNDLFNKIRESGIWRLQNFTDRQLYIFQNVLEVIIASVILITAQWWIFGLILLSTLPELILETQYGYRVWNIHTGRAELRRRFWDTKYYFDHLPSVIELKLFQNTKYFLTLIKDLLQTFRSEEQRNDRTRLIREASALVLSQGVVLFALIFFINQVIHGQLLVGTMTFFLASIGDLRQALSGLFLNLGRQYQDGLFVADVLKFIDLQPSILKAPRALKLLARRPPKIVFEKVSFSYPGQTAKVLDEITLTIAPGEKIAFVGANGAGKTTLIKLLCRFYDPSQGKVLLDGQDLKKIDPASWYNQLGVLFQDYTHYHFLVKDAIAVGRSTVKQTPALVKQAAQASEAHEFIKAWENAYEQMLGKEFKGGIEPSTGQWQKLALARTFYRAANVLILDEPTASIDAEAEEKIFEKLEALPKDRTVILISHRFSTVRRANRIVVLEKGRIIEQGSHDDLLKLNGTYAKLFNLQARGYR